MDTATVSGADAASQPLRCAVCHEGLTANEQWIGAIGSSTLCIHCARAMLGFWRDDLNVAATVTQEVSPRRPAHLQRTWQLWRTKCLGCGAPALVFESTSHRGLCPSCLEELRSELEHWRAQPGS
jgi:ribosomal protein S27E